MVLNDVLWECRSIGVPKVVGGSKMVIECFPILMSEEAARKRAMKGFAGMYGKNKTINMRLMWLENRYIEFEMTYHDSFIRKLIRKDKNKIDKQKIRTIVDATTCSGSYTETGISTIMRDVDESMIQHSNYPDDRLIHTARENVRRMVRRHAGRFVSAEMIEMRKVYRPYWIAVYGEWVEGTKVRYLPIPADGNEVYRTF